MIHCAGPGLDSSIPQAISPERQASTDFQQDSHEPVEVSTLSHILRAEQEELKGKPHSALNFWRLALLYEPDSSYLHYRMARLYWGLEEYEKAKELISIEDKPCRNFELCVLAGRLAQREGEDSKALKYYNLAHKLNESDADVVLDHLRIVLSQKDFEKADAFLLGLEESRFSVGFKAKIAGLFYDYGARKRAQVHAVEALRLEPHNSKLIRILALIDFEISQETHPKKSTQKSKWRDLLSLQIKTKTEYGFPKSDPKSFRFLFQEVREEGLKLASKNLRKKIKTLLLHPGLSFEEGLWLVRLLARRFSWTQASLFWQEISSHRVWQHEAGSFSALSARLYSDFGKSERAHLFLERALKEAETPALKRRFILALAADHLLVDSAELKKAWLIEAAWMAPSRLNQRVWPYIVNGLFMDECQIILRRSLREGRPMGALSSSMLDSLGWLGFLKEEPGSGDYLRVARHLSPQDPVHAFHLAQWYKSQGSWEKAALEAQSAKEFFPTSRLKQEIDLFVLSLNENSLEHEADHEAEHEAEHKL